MFDSIRLYLSTSGIVYIIYFDDTLMQNYYRRVIVKIILHLSVIQQDTLKQHHFSVNKNVFSQKRKQRLKNWQRSTL